MLALLILTGLAFGVLGDSGFLHSVVEQAFYFAMLHISLVVSIAFLRATLGSGLRIFIWALDPLQRITHGRAIGAVGIILASAGFSTEIYQVLTMYFGPESERETIYSAVRNLI